MNLPNIPLSRWERFCLIFVRKPVVWSFMVCTGGATLMMVQGMAQTNAPGWPKPPAKSSVGGSVAANGGTVNGGAVSSAQSEKRTDETER